MERRWFLLSPIRKHKMTTVTIAVELYVDQWREVIGQLVEAANPVAEWDADADRMTRSALLYSIARSNVLLEFLCENGHPEFSEYREDRLNNGIRILPIQEATE